MKKLTKEQAIRFYESRAWDEMTKHQIVELQLFQDNLCVPFFVFHEATDYVLGRPVYTHEFADKEALIHECLGNRPAPTLDEIIAAIPEEKRVLIAL